MKTKLYILVLILMTAFGCSEDEMPEIDKQTVLTDEIFDLRINEEVLFEEGELCIKFTTIVEDNRCPQEVDCITDGRVWIQLDITENDQITTIDLVSQSTPFIDSLKQVASICTHEIEFVAVKPDASIDVELEDEDYIISLKIREPLLSVCDHSVIIDNVAYDSLNTETYSITAVEVYGDCLYITINSNGCDSNNWDANLIDWGAVAESSPEQRYVKLELINDEICAANFYRTFIFNMTPIQTSNNEILINLEGWDDFIYYQY